MIVKIESPGTTHQTICTIGRLLVLAGAIWKGRLEIKEMLNLGLRKYFEATVIFVFNLFRSFFLHLNRALLFSKIVYHVHFVYVFISLIFFEY